MNKYVPFLFLLMALGLYLYPAPDLNSTFDIQLTDSYYVISDNHIFNALALICAFIGGLYWLASWLGIKWSKRMPVLHFATTLLLLGLFTYLSGMYQTMRTAEVLTERLYAQYRQLDLALVAVMLLFLFAQAVFLMAFAVKAIRRK